MREGDEALIPDRTTVRFSHPFWKSRWTIAAVVSTVVFIAQIFVPRPRGAPSNLILYWAMHPLLYELFLGFRAATATLQLGIAAAIWVALVRPAWSDRLLWSAALTMTAFVIVPSLPVKWHVHEFSAIAIIGFSSWAVVAWRSALSPFLRSVLGATCLLVVCYACTVPSIVRLPQLYVVGTLALASAIWCWSIAVTERFDIHVLGNP